MKPSTKEQLIFYMSNKLSLGTYDKKFVNNILGKQHITTNQATLLDKIIIRYHKQFLKNELNSEELVKLPWTKDPIQSLPEYTESYISIQEDTIILKTPYNASYVKEIKKLPYTLTWNKTDTDKYWSVVFCTETLKQVIDVTEKHYSKINYCEKIKEIINYLSYFEDCKYWNPTLVYRNDRYMLFAANEPLYNRLTDELNNIDILAISRLVMFGVSMDESVKLHLLDLLKDEEKVNFILSSNVDVDIHELDLLFENLSIIQSDFVILGPTVTRKLNVKEKIKNKLVEKNISFAWLESKTIAESYKINTSDYKSVVFIDFGISTFVNSPTQVPWSKNIRLVNNTPIQL
jgi:hypothetical protein